MSSNNCFDISSADPQKSCRFTSATFVNETLISKIAEGDILKLFSRIIPPAMVRNFAYRDLVDTPWLCCGVIHFL